MASLPSSEPATLTPELLDVFGDTDYAMGSHLPVLDAVGFRWDALYGTESDCQVPLGHAHLRGLRVQHVYGRTYAEGIREYKTLWQDLMASKHFLPHLIEQQVKSLDDTAWVRETAEEFFLEAYGITSENLVAMVMSPFASEGKNLERYLRVAFPCLVPRADEIRAALAGKVENDEILAPLSAAAALTVAQLRHLYFSALEPIPINRAKTGMTLITVLGTGDPHKVEVETRLSPDGETVIETVSGR